MAIKLPSATSRLRFNGFRTAALVANGAIFDYARMAPLIRQYDYCVAVDGGLVHCHNMEVIPDLIIGDFDSVSKELLIKYEGIPTETFPVDKDETDTEIALRAVMSSTVEKIGLFGALEKRADHALFNLHLLLRFPKKLVIETECETIFAISENKQMACRPGQVVSLMPLDAPPKGVTTQGLKWELKEATLDKDFMSLSNICLNDSFSVSISEGIVICCLGR